MSLRGKGTLHKRPGGRSRLKKVGGKLLKAGTGLLGMRGRGGMPRGRRSRGITSRQFRTAQRVLKKIVKMYSKLPRRHSTHAACARRGTR